jgi:CheY-like chemotaxis protein
VLVVDDEPANRAVVRTALEPLGYEVVAVGDAAAAARLMTGVPPCLVLLDVVLPGDSGIEVCRRWRTRPEWDAVPIVLLTALTAGAYRSLGLAAGADDFLQKPLEEDALVALAGRWADAGWNRLRRLGA